MMKTVLLALFFFICMGSLHAQPANDDCANATPLTVQIVPNPANCAPTLGTNVDATASGATPLPSCSDFGSGEDVWYSVTVPASGDVSVEMRNGG
ncbi:MAG: hypothetical protein AAGI49_17185, partial [Bacteroidota bacterium]